MSNNNRIPAALVLLILGGLLACGGSSDDAVETAEEPSGTWREVLRLYEKARETGEAVPVDTYDWVKQDLERMGDWEYRVLAFDSASETEIEASLNELGQERWECFAVVADGGSLRMLLKRPVKSYVGTIPHSELWKLLRGGDEEGEAPAE